MIPSTRISGEMINQTTLPNRRNRRTQGRYQTEYRNYRQRSQVTITRQVQDAVLYENTNNAHVPQVATRTSQMPQWAAEVGNANATCSIIKDVDNQWGKFNDADVGVLKFITKLTQDSEYRLDRMSVDICFAEHGPNDYVANTVLKVLGNPCPTDIIHGQLRREHVVRTTNMNPQVEVFGNSGGLGEHERTVETDFVRSWTYDCNWRKDKYGMSTIVQWNWNADPGDSAVQQLNALYSGVVLAHSREPFWVGCKITLKLHSHRQRYIRRFLGRARNGDENFQFQEITPSPAVINLEKVVNRLNEEVSKLMRSGSTTTEGDNITSSS